MAVSIKQIAQLIGAPDAAERYQSNLQRWDDLYACKPVEKVIELSGSTYKRHVRSARMAKVVCADWAGLCWTENAGLEGGDDASTAVLDAYFGEQFAPRFVDFLERSFAFGTGLVEVLVDGLDFTASGSVLPTRSAEIELDFVDAERIIPIAFNGRGMSEVAILSFANPGYIDVRIHRDCGTYQEIENRCFFEPKGGGKVKELSQADVLERGIAPYLRIDTVHPLFAVFKPSIANNIDKYSPFGISVFGNAEDQLHTVDLYFDNFSEDVEIGGKMVFIPDTMLRKSTVLGADGNPIPIPPQADKKNLFVALRASAGVSGGAEGIHEYNPELRVEDNKSGINGALSLLSSAVGMGAERYVYRSGAVATATQVISENSDLFRNRRKHLLAVNDLITRLARAVLWCASNFLAVPCDPETEITLNGDDSVIEDDNTRIQRGLQLFQGGAISQYTFLTEYLHMTDENAQAEVDRSKVTMPPLFG